MGNPAAELHDIFLDWSVASEKPALIGRGLRGSNSDERFDQHIRAMRLIAECEVFITALESRSSRPSAYRANLRRWAAALMHYPFHWGVTNAAEAFDRHVMDTLDGLAALMDAQGPVIPLGGDERVRELLEEVKGLLQSDQSINATVRAYVYEAVQLLIRYLDDAEFYGEAELTAAHSKLYIALSAAAGQTDEANRPKWLELCEKIGIPAAGTVLGSLPATVLQAISVLGGGA